jgi:hypothetical protein
MNSLITNLDKSGSRIFLYVPASIILEQAIIRLTNNINSSTEIVVVTNSLMRINSPNVSNFQMSQINQNFLDLFFNSPRILIIESSSILGQFTVSKEIGSIIILGTQFNSVKDLTETSRFLLNLPYKTNISPLDLTIYLGNIGYQLYGQKLEYQGVPVNINMIPIQYNEYLIQNDKSSLLNMIYPQDLQSLHNLSRSHKINITPDQPVNEGGWITLNILPEISPKINWLIQYIKLNQKKHVIYTISDTIQTISSFLRLSGFPVINVTGKDKQKDRISKIDNFNQYDGLMILITDIYAFKPLYNVSSFIMFEQHSSDIIFNNYLNQIANSGTLFLHVIFLISIGPQNQNTLDVENYNNMAKLINQRDLIFEILQTGKIDPLQISRYCQIFEIPNVSSEYFSNLFKYHNGESIMFRFISI